jgi:molybdopterin molybdotransferase
VPGNPVSSYVCAILFLVPLIRRLAGRRDPDAEPEPAVLGADLAANDERQDYLRASLQTRPGDLPIATPFPVQDSSMLRPLANSQCLVIREPYAPAAKSGSRCSIIKLAL